MNLIDKDKLLEALAEAQKQPCVSLRKLVEEQPVYHTLDLHNSYTITNEVFKIAPESDIAERIEQFFSSRFSDYLLGHNLIRRVRRVIREDLMSNTMEIEYTGTVTVILPEDEHDRT